MNSIEPWARRGRKQDYSGVLLYASIIFFLSALVFFITTVFHLTDVAKAAGTMDYRDVHTEHEACVYLHQHPGSIKNVKWCNL